MTLLIRGGTIVDGSGGGSVTGDVYAEDGIILAAGPSASGPADEIIDAAGRIVCPGFVDLHRHCDIAALGGDFGLIEISQGISSCFAGNCGMSPVPSVPESRLALLNYLEPCLGSFAQESCHTHREYVKRLREVSLPVNVGFFAGMGAIRIAVKGFENTPFTQIEMERARSFLQESLDCGAFGMSIGLMYVPEAYCSAEEIARLASVMKGGKGILCAHMRWETGRLAHAVREVIDIAKQAGVPLEISHFKAAGEKAWHGVLHEAIEIIEAERAKGFDISVDFYPYDCGSSTMMQMLPPAYLAMGPEEAIAGLARSGNVEKIRKLLAEGEKNWDNLSQTIGWDRTIINSVSLEENRKFTGKSVTACVREYGFRDEAEFAARLLYSENGRVSIINQSMSPEDIDTIARLPYSSLISDSLYGDMKNPHPRLYGAFPRFLRDFVHKRNVLDLSTAIRKMTAMPAYRAGLKDRGLLRPGYKADILIFDPDNFRDEADYLHPAKLSSRLDYAIVNGKITYRDGKLICRDAGEIVGNREE